MSNQSDLMRRDGGALARNVSFRAGREVRRLDQQAFLAAHELELRALLHQRESEHAEFATFERIHSAGILTAAARAAVELDPAAGPMVESALRDWDASAGRRFRQTYG